VLEVVDDEARQLLGFSALLFLHYFALTHTLLVGRQEGHLVCKKPVSLIPKGFLLEKVQEER